MNDLVAGGKSRELSSFSDLKFSDVITRDELLAMPMGLRIEFVPQLKDQFTEMAKAMAANELTRPHLKDKPDACYSIIKNALNWRMDPHQVASKTYSPAAGQIGIEGVLASAIMLNSGRISHIEYEHIGDWSKVENRFSQKQATWPDGNPKRKKNPKTGKYDGDPIMTITADWKPEDEKGLGVKATAIMKDGSKISAPVIYLAQCHPRNSTLWPTAPARQIIHVAERALCNMICGDILMGVHIDVGLTRNFADLEDDAPPPMRDVSPPAAAEPAKAEPVRADPAADVTGTGPTEGGQAGGYVEHDLETGEITCSPAARDSIIEPDKPAPAATSGKRKRVTIEFRGKTWYKTAFVRDIKQLIDSIDDYGELNDLEGEVKGAISTSSDPDAFDDLVQAFAKAREEFEPYEAGEQEDGDQDNGEAFGLDLVGEDD